MSRNFDITFYREIVGGNGCCRDMPVEVLQIDAAETEETAIAAAIRRFEERNRVQRWSNLASRFQVTEIARRKSGALH